MLDELRSEICSGFFIESLSENEARVHAPFYMDGGDQCSVVVRKSGEGYELTDDGDSIGRASDYGVDLLSASRRRLVEASLAAHGVSLVQDAVETRADRGKLSEAVFRMYQASWELVRMSAPPRHAQPEVKEKKFKKQLRRTILSSVPPGRVHEKWVDPRVSRLHVYPVDFYIDAPHPLLLFGVANTASCHRSTIACQFYKYRRRKRNLQRIAIYDESSPVTVISATQLNDVTDQHFVLPSERQRLEAFLTENAAA